MRAIDAGKIEVQLAQNGPARLDVFNLQGRQVGTLLSGTQASGTQTLSLGDLSLQKGVYILRLRQGSQGQALRIVYQ
jgi:hypothetical protein